MKTLYIVLGAVVLIIAGLVWCFQSGTCGSGGGGGGGAIPTASPVANLINAGTGATVAQSISSAGTALWNLITTGSAGDQ